jgi:murein DD-endopeptidase MepM/ murein hydrolase activator NlpD
LKQKQKIASIAICSMITALAVTSIIQNTYPLSLQKEIPEQSFDQNATVQEPESITDEEAPQSAADQDISPADENTPQADSATSDGINSGQAAGVAQCAVIKRPKLEKLAAKPKTKAKSSDPRKKAAKSSKGKKASRRQFGAPSSLPASGSGVLSWPVAGGRVSSGFRTKERPNHQGIDISAKEGTAVFAAGAGTVVTCGDHRNGYGKLVDIKHPDGTLTRYAHLSSVIVTVGQTVSQGELIGKVGHTGRAHGSHLHFECRGSNGQAQNPLNYCSK